jgi:uncharacterized membrane-anchored protein
MSVLRIGKSGTVNQEHLETLLNFGYEEPICRKALQNVKSVEEAVDWIERHQNDEIEPVVKPTSSLKLPSQPSNITQPSPINQIKNTNPTPTNNISSNKQPVNAKKDDVDEEAEKHKEYLMRQASKIMGEQKREREAQKIHEERLRLQLEEDRLAREAKYNKGKPSTDTSSAPVKTQSSNLRNSTTSNINSTDCAIQVKLLNGTTTMQTFLQTECALELYNYVASLMDCDVVFTLVTPYPKRELTEEDLKKSFKELGLCPKASLLVLEKKEMVYNPQEFGTEITGAPDKTSSKISSPF